MKKNFILTALFVLIFAAAAPSSLFAAAETHDGFYFNMQLGAGEAQTIVKESGFEDVTYTGMSYVGKFKIGGTPVENFIIYGVLGLFDQENPDVKYGSQTVDTNIAYLSYSEFGIGMCYYFMPENNVYFSGELAATQAAFNYDDDTPYKNSKTGYSLTLSLGKEWWISDNWGVGFALLANGVQVKRGSDQLLHGFIGLAFTATYN
jgi:hypothetical protein